MANAHSNSLKFMTDYRKKNQLKSMLFPLAIYIFNFQTYIYIYISEN